MIETLDGIRETVNYNEIKGFKLYDNTDYESYPAHWHTQIEILMPIKNTYEVTCNNQLYVLQEGDLLFVNSGVIHGMSALAGNRLIFQADFSLLHDILYVEPSLFSLPGIIHVTKEGFPDIHDRLTALMLRIRDEYQQNNLFAGAAIYSLLLEICVLLGRSHVADDEESEASTGKQKEYTAKFMYISNYIKEHCTEEITLDDAAALAGFSKYHFTRLFKNFTGTSFYKYLNIKRIEYAEQLLIDPELSVTEIALQSGFSSLSAFIRMFKLIKDCTPTEFRNLYED